MSRGSNKYRYYSIKQLALCNTIRILHNLGLPLAEIKDILKHRTPELTEELLINQIAEFSKMQARLAQTQMLLYTMLKETRAGLKADEDLITIAYMPAEQIFLGEVNDYRDGKNPYDALYDFYKHIAEKHQLSDLDMCYPVWGIVSEEQVKNNNANWPSRYYFYNPDGTDTRPAAFYAVGYTRASYGKGADLYGKMKDYISRNGFEICGDAYEEYPLNEVGVADESDYLMRVLITVCKK